MGTLVAGSLDGEHPQRSASIKDPNLV